MPGTAPVVTSDGGLSTADFSMDEGLTAVTTVVGSDSDGDALVYSLTGGLDKSKFKINATTGVLEFIAAPDYENPTDNGGDNTYEVIVTVSDGDLTFSQTITVSIVNIGATLQGSEGDDILGPSGTTSDGDFLFGYAGHDRLNGGLGADTMVGGDGLDYYYVDNAGDVVIEDNADIYTGGDDYVFSTVTYTLSDNVEHLHLDGAASINATGNDGANHLLGNSGNNVLDGKGGADRLDGEDGNDTYIVDNIGDTILEGLDKGTDTVLSSVNFTLANNVENLTLTGTVGLVGTGNGLDNFLKGTTGNDDLRGLAGNDVLNGGKGADIMRGGNGDDTYYVDSSLDIINEALGNGNDTVHAYSTYTLGDNVEKLILENGSAIDGTGNALGNQLIGNSSANVLTGHDGNDKLNGLGGNDQLIGGIGNDTYWVDNVNDTIVELAGEGRDTVKAWVSYTLSDNVENLYLGGYGKYSGTGNDLDNTLKGNVADNVLSGLGGNDILDGKYGADTMIGGLGEDTYYVNNLGDTIVEAVGEGNDTVISWKSGYALADNVENLRLGGKANINGSGNDLNNTITGNGGNNQLDGGGGFDTVRGGGGYDTIIGGDGADDLYGGGGNDKFIINNLSESGTTDATNDWIFDFSGGDKLDVSAVDANQSTVGDEAFALDVDGIYTAGEIQLETKGADVFASFYVDNDSIADMTVRFKNVSIDTIDATDFIL